MEKKKIDIDEVVVEFMEGYLNFHNKKHNTNYCLEDITNYHLWKCKIHNSKEESVRDVMDFQNSEYFNEISLIEDSKRSLENLSKKNKIYFITSRPEELKQKTIDFFGFHFPENGYQFIFSGEIYGGKSKSEICKEFDINIMIEDNADYALDCAKNGIKTFLLDKPWNQNYEKHENMIRVNNWKEIIEGLK